MPIAISAAQTESHGFHRWAEGPSLGAGKIEKRLYIVFVFVERAERREIPAAGITLRDQVFPGSPSEFGPAVLNGDDVRDHSRMAAVSICEGMNSRQLVMKTKQRFIARERSVFQPVSRIGKELGNSLDDLSRIARHVSLGLTVRAGPPPDVVEHPVMQVSDIQFIQRVEGFHRSAIKRPIARRQYVQGFVFI